MCYDYNFGPGTKLTIVGEAGVSRVGMKRGSLSGKHGKEEMTQALGSWLKRLQLHV